MPITPQLQGMCFQNQDLSWLAKKAFVSYVKSIYLQKDREVFKFDDLDLDGLAQSLGLPGTPQVKFQKGEDAKKLKNAPRYTISSGSESEGEGGKKKKDEVRTKAQRMFERKNQDVLSSHYRKLMDDGDGDSDDDFLEVKRVLKDGELDAASGNAKAEDGRR